MAEVEEISRTASPSTQKIYTGRRVCRVWRLPRSTFYAQCQRARQRPGPMGPCSDEMLVEHTRTSTRRVLRLMRQYGLLAPKRRGRSPGPRHHDGTIITHRINDMWGTDLTTTMTLTEGQANIFFPIHAAPFATRFEALEPIRQGVRHHFGAFGLRWLKG